MSQSIIAGQRGAFEHAYGLMARGLAAARPEGCFLEHCAFCPAENGVTQPIGYRQF